MGSSYRDDLALGYKREWETRLRSAVMEICHVADEVSATIGEDGQYDNAADDGALVALLRLAANIVLGELPPYRAPLVNEASDRK